MKTPEEVAGEDCAAMHTRFAGSDWTRMLPTHISVMLGNNIWGMPLWRRRAMPPRGTIFELDSFEDYLMKPFREGLGLKSWWSIDCALRTQGPVGLEAISMIKSEIGGEKYDHNVKVSQWQTIGQSAPAEPAVRAGPGRGHKTDAGGIRFSGRSTAGIVARLQRDRPDIAQRLARGEFKSAREAARAAGIRLDQTPLQWLRRGWKAASEDERAAFLAEIGH